MDKLLRVLVTTTIVLILVFAAFAGGFVFGRHGGIGSQLPGVANPPQDTADKVNEVLDILNAEALNPPTETSATAGAIQGVLDSTGDKYAMYFDARHFKYFNEQNSGEFGGIGVTIGEKDGQAYVVTVMPKTPAAHGRYEGERRLRRDRRRATRQMDERRGRQASPRRRGHQGQDRRQARQGRRRPSTSRAR